MKLLFGLGNIGSSYEDTRHNVGFMFVDYYSAIFGNTAWKKGPDDVSLHRYCDNGVVCVKPNLLMNKSGVALGKVLEYFPNIVVSTDLLIVHDEIAFDVGTYSLDWGKGANAHNGVRDIFVKLETQEFSRLRIGIKEAALIDPGGKSEYVLSDFSDTARDRIGEVFASSMEEVGSWVAMKGK